MGQQIVSTSVVLLLVALSVLRSQPDAACNMGRGTPDPRNEKVICLPQIGRMEGTLDCVRGGEQYGRNIYAVGDVNHDGLQDWIVGHLRCDNVIYPDSSTVYIPEDILLYKGVRGALPSMGSGERIGPSEIGSATKYVASGDWDADGNIDIACRIRVFGDTSFGNRGSAVGNVIVFWGQVGGKYTCDDTTHLSNGVGAWSGPDDAISRDIDHDGIDDLFILNRFGDALAEGKVVKAPHFLCYRGHRQERWGRRGIPRRADWTWWNNTDCTQLGAIDQDGDGILDLALYDNSTTGVLGHLTLLYGNPHGLPDTNDTESVDFTAAGGHASLFSDVTGDHVPELLVHTGRNPSSNSVKVYIGLKGQRLTEQYGSGNDPAQLDSTRWWGRPWAEIWLPFRIDTRWFLSDPLLLDFGDGNLDGVGDIWAYSWPYLLCYSGEEHLDSLVDGMLDTRPAIQAGANAVLGDIDGSGRRVLGFGDGNAVVFFSGSERMSSDGTSRRLPQGTEPSGSEVPAGKTMSGETLRLSRNDTP